MGEKRRILNIIIIHFEEECVVLFTASVYRSALSLSLFFFRISLFFFLFFIIIILEEEEESKN